MAHWLANSLQSQHTQNNHLFIQMCFLNPNSGSVWCWAGSKLWVFLLPAASKVDTDESPWENREFCWLEHREWTEVMSWKVDDSSWVHHLKWHLPHTGDVDTNEILIILASYLLTLPKGNMCCYAVTLNSEGYFSPQIPGEQPETKRQLTP